MTTFAKVNVNVVKARGQSYSTHAASGYLKWLGGLALMHICEFKQKPVCVCVSASV